MFNILGHGWLFVAWLVAMAGGHGFWPGHKLWPPAIYAYYTYLLHLHMGIGHKLAVQAWATSHGHQLWQQARPQAMATSHFSVLAYACYTQLLTYYTDGNWPQAGCLSLGHKPWPPAMATSQATSHGHQSFFGFGLCMLFTYLLY